MLLWYFPVFTSCSCGGGRLLFPGARSNKLSEGGGTNDSFEGFYNCKNSFENCGFEKSSMS